MAAAAGFVSRDVPQGTGWPLAREVCWSDTQSVALCSDAGLVEIALSDRTLYFRSADKVKGIRMGAPPL